jgi:hypothetical protein
MWSLAGRLWTGERPKELWADMRNHRPIAVGVATYGGCHDSVRKLRGVSDAPVGFLLDPYVQPDTHGRPIEWISECLTPLLEEGLLGFCGLSCTVPSIEWIRVTADLTRSR